MPTSGAVWHLRTAERGGGDDRRAAKPEHYEATNAVGAPSAWMSAEIDRVYSLGDGG